MSTRMSYECHESLALVVRRSSPERAGSSTGAVPPLSDGVSSAVFATDAHVIARNRCCGRSERGRRFKPARSCNRMHFPDYEVRLAVDRKRPARPPQFMNARQIYEFTAALRAEPCEWMYELLLDTKHRLQGVYLLGKGGVSSCVADPTQVYVAALTTNSPVFVLVHNHPSGCPDPSPEDVRLAERIDTGAALLGLECLDNIIVGGDGYYSFRDRRHVKRDEEWPVLGVIPE